MKRKLVVKIGGGLGNQMHEYALGRFLADMTDRELVWDLTDFTISSLREFQLFHFTGTEKIRRWGCVREWAFFLLWVINRKISERLFKQILKLFKIKWVSVGNPFEFQPDLTDSSLKEWKGLIYLSGCYGHIPQMPSREELRRIFTAKNELSPRNKDYYNLMKTTESVSVHVRRTDYLWASNGTPALDISYHRASMVKIQQMISSPQWFIFSDDIKWCRREFCDLKNVVFVEGNENNPWLDIQLMAACRHHVIANSTFSWWGAYLGEDTGVTLYPAPWFRGRGSSLELPSTARAGNWIAVLW
jgi:hypothetical protein